MVGIINRRFITEICIGLFVACIFLIGFYLFHHQLFTYRFDETLISQYLLSQDIPKEVPAKRVFLSDSDIHIAAGYLYVHNYEPTTFNFQHPPFIKYLYGLSILLTGNPFWIQLLFGAVLVVLTYLIGRIFFDSLRVGLVASFFLLIDPLFNHVGTQALLDLGQAVFVTAFLIISLRYPKWVVLQGILLGLAAVSKFFSSVVFVWIGLLLFQWYKTKKLEVFSYIVQLMVAFGVFYLVYFATALQQNIIAPVFYQFKMLKYWLHHSVASFFSANLVLFLTGVFKPWWGNEKMEMSAIWTTAWPVTTGVAVYELYVFMRNKVRTIPSYVFVYLFPLFYLVTLAIQTPFVRYFIVILPWLYVGFAAFIVKSMKKE